MKKTKFGVVACIGFSVLLLGGCGSKVDEKAVSAFGNGVLRFKDVKSAEYKVEASGKIDGENGKFIVDGAYDLRDKMGADLNVSIESQGVKMANVITLSLKDSVLYMDAMSNKQSITFETVKPMLTSLIEGQKDVKFTKKNKEELTNVLSKASLEDNKLSLEFDMKALNKEIKKLDNKEAKDMEVKKLNFTGTVNKKYLETGKIMFEIHNKGTKETIKFTVKYSLKNMNKDVKLKDVVPTEFGIPVDAMQFFGGSMPPLMN
ncbi:MAG: hypothetical protein RR945_06435 [Erysipelotrichaceae bacterium]